MHVKRSLALLLGAAGASMSAGAGYLYLGEDETHASIESARKKLVSSPQEDVVKSRLVEHKASRRRPLHSVSKKELGIEQSYARDLACWISSATVYAATQAFYATSGSNPTGQVSTKKRIKENNTALVTPSLTVGDVPVNVTRNGLYHGMFGWLQELSPLGGWDANQVIQSSSFAVLLNLVSGVDNLKLREDMEHEMYRAVGLLATNPQCAKVIAERATRYGKHALLNLAHAHDMDPRMGAALHDMVHNEDDKSSIRFGPANLISLVALAVSDDIPDEYLEFALWGLGKAVGSSKQSGAYEWRKRIFGDDSSVKTRRKLIGNDRLWSALINARGKSEDVQLQAARLLSQLSQDAQMKKKMKRHLATMDMLMQWVNSKNGVLASSALDVIANIASDTGLRDQLFAMGALEALRARLLTNGDDAKLTSSLLRAVRHLADPHLANQEQYALDQDSLSFLNETDEDHPLYHDDLVHPDSILKHHYVDGWIEMFTSLLRSDDNDVRSEAALCLDQIVRYGKHQNQGLQEWLIAVLDGVLEKVPESVTKSSTSVRAARSRTRPIAERQTEGNDFSASHAKAIRALAFVAGRPDCQEQFARLGGIPLLKALLHSENLQVRREVARVLANMFTCDDLDEEIAAFARNDDQLTSVLDDWTQSTDAMLQSLAHRARSNRRYQHDRLENADVSDVKYLDGVHPLHYSTSPAFNNGNQNPSSLDNSSEYDVDVVFIHGLLGCPYETWVSGEDESTVWAQEWLLEDLKRDGHNPRVLSIGYDSQLLASESVWQTMCFKETSQDVLKKLMAARVGDRPVVFITHSLGGVLLKQVLLESAETNSGVASPDSDLLNKVSGVVFYGVPHHGSPIAQTIQAFRPRSLGIEQHPVTEHLHGTPHLELLNDWCSQVFEEKNISSISIGESVPCRLPVISVDALVVPPSSANPGFGEFVAIENSTHIDVCKPRSKEDPRYVLAREFIAKQTQMIDFDDVE
ncbi:hypothetical protein Poli38472_012080 [Pythium oligandrum]|uniref:Protein SERAC1 n=1 Tax=Pythium oligandrum TaxID=41045 RepID=A0A8K1CPP9_PYTOL|nr:hypothetical protein Poli38472_012080 [Pythium oligandrum]|eukprot:TMW66964.1 hypothetical protein Poli38472_012080 [Pythium oligandrum]